MGFDDPRNQGLLALAAGLMAPSRGGSFGGAALQGLQGYQQAYGNASNVQAQQEQMRMMREQYEAKKSAAEKAQQTQEALKKLSGALIGSIGTPRQTPQSPQQMARPSPQEASGLYQPPPMMGEMPAMGQNRAEMGLPSGGYGQMQPAASNGRSDHQRQLLAQIALLDPDVAEKLQNIVMPKPEKLVFQDGNAMDPYTGEVRSKYDPRPPTFNPMTNLIRPDGTINQALYDAQKGLRAAGRPSVEVKNQFPGKESEFAKLDEKNRAEALDEMRKRSLAAPATIMQYKEVGRALKDIDGGIIEQGKTGVARFAKSFGIEIDPNLPAKEYAESVALQLAMRMKPVGSGSTTEKDMEQFIAMAPGLSQTAKGRQMIIDSAVKAAERDKRIFQMSIEHRKKNKGILDDTFFEKVSNYVNDNPIIPKGFQVPEPTQSVQPSSQPGYKPTQQEVQEALRIINGVK